MKLYYRKRFKTRYKTKSLDNFKGYLPHHHDVMPILNVDLDLQEFWKTVIIKMIGCNSTKGPGSRSTRGPDSDPSARTHQHLSYQKSWSATNASTIKQYNSDQVDNYSDQVRLSLLIFFWKKNNNSIDEIRDACKARVGVRIGSYEAHFSYHSHH